MRPLTLILCLFLMGASKPRPHLRIIKVDLPHWLIGGTKTPIKTVHIAAHVKPHLIKALRCVSRAERRLGTQLLFTFDGTYVPKLIRGTNRWSRHAYGEAIDINAFHPPQSPIIVKCFEGAGWNWGGRWKNKDPMHFEWRKG